jgi:hypothetical protein
MFFYLGGIVEGHIAIPEKKKITVPNLSLYFVFLCFVLFWCVTKD